MEPHSFDNLGAISRPIDQRDYKLGTTTTPTPIPLVHMQANAWNAPIYYQGKRPSCGGHSGTWLNTLLNSYSGTTTKCSPRYTWIEIKADDPYGTSDGTDMRYIFQALQSTGTASYEPLEDDVTLDDATYANPSAVTPAMEAEGATNVVSHYAFADNLTFQGLKELIYQNRGVIIMYKVGEEMWTAPNGTISWAEKDTQPLRPPAKVVSQHFVVCHSYDENYIYFANSWGPTYGRNGHGYFGEGYMPYVMEAGTAATVAAWVTDNLKKQVSLAQQVVDLLKRLITLK